MIDSAPAAPGQPGDPAYAWGPPGPSWQLGLRAAGPDQAYVELYAAVRRTGTDEILPAGTLALQTRGSGGTTEDGSGPRPTAELPLTAKVTEVAGWRLPVVPDDSYRATFTVPGGPTLESGWVSAPAP
jgi:hypothetical protein